MKTTIKFTLPNRQPIYGISDYPPVGEWSDSRKPIICKSGWHVSNDNTLAVYLGQEMWIVEVDGKVVSDTNKSSYEKIRFVSQVETWDMVGFARECAERAKTAYAADAATDAAAYAAAYVAERKWQSDRLREIAGIQ